MTILGLAESVKTIGDKAYLTCIDKKLKLISLRID